MTEDDTFRILSRPSYDEINALYQALGKVSPGIGLRRKEEFFNKYRWTRKEFLEKRKKRFLEKYGDIRS